MILSQFNENNKYYPIPFFVNGLFAIELYLKTIYLVDNKKTTFLVVKLLKYDYTLFVLCFIKCFFNEHVLRFGLFLLLVF